MKIKSQELAQAIRKVVLKQHADRKLVSYYQANVLLAVVYRTNDIGKALNKRAYKHFKNEDGFKWGYRSQVTGIVFIGCLTDELATVWDFENNQGAWVSDVYAHSLTTWENGHVPLASVSHEIMWNMARS